MLSPCKKGGLGSSEACNVACDGSKTFVVKYQLEVVKCVVPLGQVAVKRVAMGDVAYGGELGSDEACDEHINGQVATNLVGQGVSLLKAHVGGGSSSLVC